MDAPSVAKLVGEGPPVLRIYVRPVPGDARVRVEILDVGRFTTELGETLANALCRTLAGLEVLVGLFHAGEAIEGQDPRGQSARNVLVLLAFGTMAELAIHLKALPLAMRAARMDMPELDTLGAIGVRWRNAERSIIRQKVSHHFDDEKVRAGLRTLAANGMSTLLVDEHGALPCFGIGIDALLAGVAADVTMIGELKRDSIRVALAMRVILSRIVFFYDFPREELHELPSVIYR